MNDFGRFLRYVVPGSVFIALVTVFGVCAFLTLSPEEASAVVDLLSAADATANLWTTSATLIAGVAVSGGLGYVFSVIHYTLCAHLPFYMYAWDKHIDLLRSLGWSPAKTSREANWQVAAILFHACEASAPQRLFDYAKSINSAMQGAGSSFVASAFAYFVWYVSVGAITGSGPPLLLTFLFAFAVFMFLLNFLRLQRHSLVLVENCIALSQNSSRSVNVELNWCAGNAKANEVGKSISDVRKAHVFTAILLLAAVCLLPALVKLPVLPEECIGWAVVGSLAVLGATGLCLWQAYSG